MYYIGFDIGGSSVKAVLVEDKKIIKSIIEDLPDNLEGLFGLLKKIFDELKEGAGLSASQAGALRVGVSLAGAIDAKREVMLNSPNITYLNSQPIKKLIADKLGCEVKIEHDVHCFLLAEKEVGLAKDLKDAFYLTLGTGIGGAFMIGGEVILGAHGAAGEVGHMIIDAAGGLELEDLAADKFLQKSLGVKSLKAREMVEAGDQKAIEVVKQMSSNLGVGVANIINIFDPEAIVLSGGIIWAKDFLLAGVADGVEKFVCSPEAKKTPILFSELDRFGGALGAALLFE